MADKEYIEREAVIEKLMNLDPPGFEQSIAGKVALMQIAAFPKADVVEVRRGRWLPQRLLGADVVDCSECKTLGSPQWKWCPVCGADMRGEKNDKDRES